ncbi:MAG: hypothetical protein COU10_01925 [Candidatus Harrisonbacteria bacterium CG10_big_fil_rev_8_21_14_0_10_45_28]|uniref:Uncharacterized protein n=1 Tax=Candidatus Harrisonbacteria bacterium CG10_big_fil_rev_8_21_14_0_10_45_28 TaxID=1974586 RepID=A0A2H0UNC8_9BACT|nr:MAG: hypothetical protein COU10_01925 [Candidatus Harrisonbacteria bacterium CG10_big_fil_rev_8_21_14_0_10_45_28]
MLRITRNNFKKVSVWTLILSNLIPLIGVIFWGWSVFQLLFAFWCESAVIGIYTIIRLAVKRSISFILFFIIHFGAFMQGHLLVLVVFFHDGVSVSLEMALLGAKVSLPATFLIIWPAVLAMTISHGVSFYSNFLKNKEYVNLVPARIMLAPYPRIVVMHLVVIFGAFLAILLGNPIGGLIVLVILKAGLDIFSHIKEH